MTTGTVSPPTFSGKDSIRVCGAVAVPPVCAHRGWVDDRPLDQIAAGIEGLAVWSSWTPQRQHLTRMHAESIATALTTGPMVQEAGWAQRWAAAGIDGHEQWRERLSIAAGCDPAFAGHRERVKPVHGLFGLMLSGVIAPSYRLLAQLRLGEPWYDDIRTTFAAAEFEQLRIQASELGATPRSVHAAMQTITKMTLHTGMTPFQLGIPEFEEFAAATPAAPTGMTAVWDMLRGHGIPADLSYRAHARDGQLDTITLVDRHHLRHGPVRDVLIRYLNERRPAMDYTGFTNLCRYLVGSFWADIERHHPEVSTLKIPAEVIAAWKQRLQYTRRANMAVRPRKDYLHHLMAVRAFYLTIAEWAATDPTWAPHAVPCPIRRAETAGIAKHRRRTVAAIHQRIRERLPRLPELLDAAGTQYRDRAAILATATATPIGDIFTHAGETYVRSTTRRKDAHGSPEIIAEHTTTGQRRRLRAEEDATFWSWAIIEVLRHTGIRIEELLELTHLSLIQHRLDDTGEIVPLLQIMPSKTDQERLLLVSPELASVLATIVHRLRGIGGGHVPVIERWDRHERITTPALPHLFQRQSGHRNQVISVTTVQNLINRSLHTAGLTDQTGDPIVFTPHDFRRIFATDAVTTGLPVHITARILGHKRITTTESYVAVFQDDLIRTYRHHLTQRRATRPAGEYRDPTTEEWREFQQHFELRQLELGTCARPYATPCRHEHACIRCPMLHVDPRQRDRLRAIITNLAERIREARMNNWRGEIDGLTTSLHHATTKLAAIPHPDAPTQLGLPTTRKD